MSVSGIDFRQDSASAETVLEHLRACSDDFDPPLPDRVHVEAYARKLALRAVKFEAWAGNRLVGLVAAYVGEPGGDDANATVSAFITNVSVMNEFTGQGIATALLNRSIGACADRRVLAIDLEVSRRNVRTVSWYESFGFRTVQTRHDLLRMRLREFGHRGKRRDEVHPYASAAYAAAFAEFEVIPLPKVRSHVLKRAIPGASGFDARGCYPLFVFDPDAGLREDLQSLAEAGLVSLIGVTDCLSQPKSEFLRAHFDVCRPFKKHFIYDARLPDSEYSKHHRSRVRRARKSCETRVIDLTDHMDDWSRCYETLTRRRGITGIQAFSRSYFERIAEMPEAITVAAFAGDELTSAHIWFRFQGNVYAHLAASTKLGYKLRSAFAVYDHAIQLFRRDHVIDLGGGAGAESSGADGLGAFKRGFANCERNNYLCGKILNQKAYAELSARFGRGGDFFPAYRSARDA